MYDLRFKQKKFNRTRCNRFVRVREWMFTLCISGRVEQSIECLSLCVCPCVWTVDCLSNEMTFDLNIRHAG